MEWGCGTDGVGVWHRWSWGVAKVWHTMEWGCGTGVAHNGVGVWHRCGTQWSGGVAQVWHTMEWVCGTQWSGGVAKVWHRWSGSQFKINGGGAPGVLLVKQAYVLDAVQR